jgi:hypothetical protein
MPDQIDCAFENQAFAGACQSGQPPDCLPMSSRRRLRWHSGFRINGNIPFWFSAVQRLAHCAARESAILQVAQQAVIASQGVARADLHRTTSRAA